MVDDVVDDADSRGQLRAILEAVKASRIADDCSDRWSFAREDFERKLYRKRGKPTVKFIELTDTIRGPWPPQLDTRFTADLGSLRTDAKPRFSPWALRLM